MGKKGREIVNVNINDLHTELNKAYADEWIAYYYYKWAATVVAGRGSPNVAKELERIAEEEEHAEELAARIRARRRSSLERSSSGSQTWSETYPVATWRGQVRWHEVLKDHWRNRV